MTPTIALLTAVAVVGVYLFRGLVNAAWIVWLASGLHLNPWEDR